MKLDWTLLNHSGPEKGAKLPDGRALIIERDTFYSQWTLFLVKGQRFTPINCIPLGGEATDGDRVQRLQGVAEGRADELFPLQALAAEGKETA